MSSKEGNTCKSTVINEKGSNREEDKNTTETNKERINDNHSNDLIIDDGFPALNDFKDNGLNKDTKISKDPIPRSSFESFSSALTISKEQTDNIVHDCELTFTARTKEDSDAYSNGATYFVPASMKPRCALEKLAMEIFKTHTKDLIPGRHYDVERSGAEWWTLVLEVNNNEEDNEEEEDGDDEVGMHFDADYGLEEQLPNYMLHPRVATVTYLSNVGVPTLILNKRSPPPTDVDKKSLNGSIGLGWISCPMLGKHIAFDGRLLHGAIETFLPTASPNKSACDEKNVKRRRVGDEGEYIEKELKPIVGKRVTFMVNIWINHCPIDAELIEDDLCAKMKTNWEETDDARKDGCRLKGDESYENPLKWKLDDVDKRDHFDTRDLKSSGNLDETIDSVICNREVTMNFHTDPKARQEIAQAAYDCEAKSIEIRFQDNALEVVVGNIVADSDDEEEDGDKN
mmetsp:Transcript_27502/g.32095  ORF Transcript_27502/g.32095 Transcript_27502/m.32095 type:complete len:457 (-) Transcript_27502:25-1395(-)